ncbi:leucine-rich repeat-containing protein 24 isoform X1 [Gadus morhua]|uniref:leucine-rich repeat-containing protein 24 isoform X1 n=1 Tax=Gadus morhua TaxID=8049 RepID=UPI0011B55CF5|nr:leucine-rich repeat-containing protein 24-like isoform X1 [Gadus morhua]
MTINEPTRRWALLLPLLALLPGGPRGLAQACVCPRATVVTRLPAEIPGGACCLNYSGSALGRVSWPGFSDDDDNNNNNNNNDPHHHNASRPRLEVLDLSRCNITHIEPGFGRAATGLREVHLQHNRLAALPEDFLARQPGLRVLDLGSNRLLELPEGLLGGSGALRRLGLAGNRLRSLEPVAWVLRAPRLSRLELELNPWDCSCGLVELLAVATATGANGTVSSGPSANLTCASPRKLEGVAVLSLSPDAVCQPPGLTALFILLPLLLLAGLLLCWCCGRKRKRRSDATFGSKKRKSKQSQKAPAAGFRDQPRKPARPVANGDPAPADGAPERGGGPPERGGGILKKQLLLRPASPLFSSTQDLPQQVEAEPKLGSASLRDSRASVSSAEGGGSGLGLPGNTTAGGGGAGEGGGGRGAELDDVVSVSEVLKDSANREKAYLVQSTEYYSLLPGMDLGGSDHGDYESVDLA